jgi:SurA N-terminal domain
MERRRLRSIEYGSSTSAASTGPCACAAPQEAFRRKEYAPAAMGRIPWTRLLLGVFGLALMIVLPAGAQAPAGGCPPSPTSPVSAPPTTSPLTSPLSPPPEQIVACVGAQSITGATFSHWASIARKSEEPSPKAVQTASKHHAPSADEVISQVMGFLISSDWMLGEATDLNIHVSESEVRHTFDHIRTQQFPKKKEFKAFLRQSGETVADLLFRVRLNLTSTRIQKHVLAGHRGSRSQQHALKRFVHDFKLKWEAQTYCDPGYAVTDCGHVQASL